MTSSIVWRIVWKEYRALRTLWIAVAAMAVMIQWWIANFGGQVSMASDSVHIVAAIMAALYGLAAAATLFAREREEGTRDFLAWLPGSDAQVAAGKLLLLAASTAAFFAAAWCTASLMVERRSYISPLWSAWSVESWSVAIVELVGWGLLFSLVMRRVVLAAVLAATAELATVIALSWIVTSVWFRDTDAAAKMMIARLAVAGVVYAVALWHAARWLHGTDGRHEAVGARDATSSSSLGAVVSRMLAGVWGGAGVREAPAWQGLARLVWQTVRQSWRMHAWLVAIWIVVMACLWLTISQIPEPSVSPNRRVVFAMLMLASACMAFVLPAIAGVETFLHDQAQRRYRFFAEHAIAPRQAWLARQAVGLAVTLAMSAALLIVVARGSLFSFTSLMLRDAAHSYSTMAGTSMPGAPMLATLVDSLSASWSFYWLGVLACYAAGQFASMFLRGGILAAVTALVMSFGLLFWLQWMIWLDAAWWWSSAPLIAALFAATWLRADGWATDRNGWRHWTLVTSSVLVPLAAVLVAVPLYRAYQLPLVDPGFDVAEFSAVDREANETTQMYAAALALAESPDQRAEAIQLAVSASLRARLSRDARFFDIRSDRTLRDHLLAEANRLAAARNWDQAWPLYAASLRMLNHAYAHAPTRAQLQSGAFAEAEALRQILTSVASHGVTAAQIKAAIQDMQAIFAATPSIDAPIKHGYADELRQLPSTRDWSIAWKPWERVRRERARAIVTRVNIERVHYLEREIATGAPGSPLRFYPAQLIEQSHFASNNPLARAEIDPLYRDGATFGAPLDVREVRALRSTWFFESGPEMLEYRDLARGLAERETCRRVTLAALAVLAWRAEYGEAPHMLLDVAPKYLDKALVDPWTGQRLTLVERDLHVLGIKDTWLMSTAFYNWFGDPFAILESMDRNPSMPRARVSSLCIWCAGPRIDIDVPTDWRSATAMILDANLTRRLPTSELDLLAAGRFFPIPDGPPRPPNDD